MTLGFYRGFLNYRNCGRKYSIELLPEIHSVHFLKLLLAVDGLFSLLIGLLELIVNNKIIYM